MVGMLLLNPICGIIGLQYISPSIGSALSGLTIVWVVLLSGPLLREYPTYYQIMASCFILMGEIIIALFGDHTNGTKTSSTNESIRCNQLTNNGTTTSITGYINSNNNMTCHSELVFDEIVRTCF